jgi:hypothetical protein
LLDIAVLPIDLNNKYLHMKKCIFCMANGLLFLCCAFAQGKVRPLKIISNQTAMLSTNPLIARDVPDMKIVRSGKSIHNS